jgi:membrane fusion protein (multidrug efflux system)
MKQSAFLAVVVIVTLAVLALWQFSGTGQGAQQQQVQVVNVEKPRMTELTRHIEAVGSAQALRSLSVSSEVDGRVMRIAMQEGGQAKAGDLLLTLDDRTAKAELASAAAALADARTAWQRAERLRHTRAVSEAEVDSLQAALDSAEAAHQAAAARLSYHQIRAPFAGTLGLRQVDAGSYLRAGDVITTLDAVDQLEVQFTVPERDIALLALGQTLTAYSDSWPEKAFPGKVTQIDSRVDSVNRAITVKAQLDNREKLLRPGQFLQVSLAVSQQQGLMIPEQAVLTQGVVSYAFVLEGEKVQRRELKLGSRELGWVEVRSGIEVDDSVVINGHGRLGDGSTVQVVEDPEALLPSL